jgi:hypothetical protein
MERAHHVPWEEKMRIGKQRKTIIVEPLWLPAPLRREEPAPTPTKEPAPAKELVPARP